VWAELPPVCLLWCRTLVVGRHCTSCQGALKAAQRLSKLGMRMLVAVLALSPWLVAHSWPSILTAATGVTSATGLRGGMRAIGALLVASRSLLAAGLVAASVGAGRELARSIERRLTSGLSEYPPPRNQPADSKTKARELRTVEQGRRS
jgi:hypothetical protein